MAKITIHPQDQELTARIAPAPAGDRRLPAHKSLEQRGRLPADACSHPSEAATRIGDHPLGGGG